MTYKIEFTNKSKFPLFVKDKQTNDKTPITLIGQGSENYGSGVWSILIGYLENYASPVSPKPSAFEGMLWFNSTSNTLMINTSKDLYQPKWEMIQNKKEIDTSGLLTKSGGMLTHDLKLTGVISGPTQVATKDYVDANRNIAFGAVDDRYQYNLMKYNGYMTLNGAIQQNEFKDNSFTVMLPVAMKDTNYSALATVGTKSKNIEMANEPSGHHYYITNKSTSSFILHIDAGLPADCEIQITVVGFTKV
jgi:hypothetical protein